MSITANPTTQDSPPLRPHAIGGPPIKNPQSKIKNSPPAFTIIELIVAISVLSLMMFLATRIFYDAQSGVQRGLQTSQIIATARSVSQPLTEDVRNMNVFESKYGSNNPGFLVISQQAFEGVLYPALDDITDDTSFWTADRDGDRTPGEYIGPGLPNDYFDDLMRSDQIAFFRNANNLESLTPGEASRYDSDAQARYARIWYGHVSPVTGGPSLNPGNLDYNVSSQLTLGRQALLLVENDASTVYPGGWNGDRMGGTGIEGRVANGGTAFGDVAGNTFAGTTDVLDLNTFQRDGSVFAIYDDGGTLPVGGGNLAMFRTPTFDAFGGITESLFGGRSGIGAGGLPNIDYATFASEWLYLQPGERLQARTFIENDFSAGIFEANEIGQLHGSFAPHVADFAIEIAADWVDDWDAANGTAGQDGQPDYEPDRDDAGNIVWYTLVRPNPDGSNLSTGLPTGDGAYDGIGQVRRSEPVTYNAALINVARFDGSVGTYGGNPFVFFGNTFVFPHTGDNLATDSVTNPPDLVEGSGKYWPYLIRFRYRLMDGRGEFRTLEIDPVSGDELSVVGRWFEQVVPVPRPRTPG